MLIFSFNFAERWLASELFFSARWTLLARVMGAVNFYVRSSLIFFLSMVTDSLREILMFRFIALNLKSVEASHADGFFTTENILQRM